MSYHLSLVKNVKQQICHVSSIAFLIQISSFASDQKIHDKPLCELNTVSFWGPNEQSLFSIRNEQPKELKWGENAIKRKIFHIYLNISQYWGLPCVDCPTSLDIVLRLGIFSHWESRFGSQKIETLPYTWAPNRGEPGFWQEQLGRHLVHQLREADTWHRRLWEGIWSERGPRVWPCSPRIRLSGTLPEILEAY